MKKIFTIFILMLVCIISISSVNVSANSNENFIEENAEIFYQQDNIVISLFNQNGTVKEISEKIENNILFEYIPYDQLVLENNSEKNVAKLYYNKNGTFYEDTLSTYSNNQDEIEKEIIDFFEQRMIFIQQNEYKSTRDVSTDLFTFVTSGYKRIVKKPYGYMDHTYTIKKYRVNDATSLYIVETDSEFVPGQIAYNNGDTSYDSKMRNNFGYVHLIANQAVEELDQSTIHYGATPYFKDAWPVNSPGTISISSTVNVGLNLGYSFTNGFSLDNISVENQSSIGANIGYSYSKTYTNQEPKLSTQHGSNYNEYQWSFQYADGKNGDETVHLRTGYMFEMSNTNHSLIGEGQFALEYNFRMKVEKWSQFIFWFGTEQDPFDGQLYVNWW